jgi:hypothetical protein
MVLVEIGGREKKNYLVAMRKISYRAYLWSIAFGVGFFQVHLALPVVSRRSCGQLMDGPFLDHDLQVPRYLPPIIDGPDFPLDSPSLMSILPTLYLRAQDYLVPCSSSFFNSKKKSSAGYLATSFCSTAGYMAINTETVVTERISRSTTGTCQTWG